MGLVAVSLGAVGALFAVAQSILWPTKPIPPALVDGTYSNACCSNLVLKQGRLGIDGRWFSFSLDRDKEGLFALPEVGISIANGHLALGVNRPYKLRFDNPDHPSSIEVADFGQNTDYVLVRR